ncbi:hypothetical protein, partial [Streptomyces sp. NPDC058671]|uniref:hypothetical protein n=1 Tax=Streptomyces sp. NPDC058671 TaxID=3346590 RepID=UPI00365CAE0F
MHSMTAALAAHTLAPPDPAQEQQARWFADAWNWASAHLPGGNFTILGGLLLLGLIAQGKDKSGKKTDWKKANLWSLITGVFKGLWSLITGVFKGLWAIVRFYGGYPMRGEARTDATFWSRGTRSTIPAGPAGPVARGSVAFAPPVVSLIKPKRRRPSPWARTAAAWVKTYQGWGATALDRGLRVLLWAVRWAQKTYRGYQNVARLVRAVYGAVAPVVATLARALRAWHFWPYAARGLARLVLTAALVGLTLPAWRTLTLVVLAVLLVVAVALAHRFKPAPPGDDAVYGPRLWVILREDLDLPEDEPRENWLRLPDKLGAEGARILIRLPWSFRGTQGEKDDVTSLLNSRLPGEWQGRYTFTGEHFSAVYTHKPPPKPPAPAPEPPGAVDIWDPKVQEILASLGPDEFYLGQDTFDRPVIQKMSDELAHWALS